MQQPAELNQAERQIVEMIRQIQQHESHNRPVTLIVRVLRRSVQVERGAPKGEYICGDIRHVDR